MRRHRASPQVCVHIHTWKPLLLPTAELPLSTPTPEPTPTPESTPAPTGPTPVLPHLPTATPVPTACPTPVPTASPLLPLYPLLPPCPLLPLPCYPWVPTATPTPIPTSSPAGRREITLGSSKDDVLHVHGTPRTFHVGSESETWYYSGQHHVLAPPRGHSWQPHPLRPGSTPGYFTLASSIHGRIRGSIAGNITFSRTGGKALRPNCFPRPASPQPPDISLSALPRMTSSTFTALLEPFRIRLPGTIASYSRSPKNASPADGSSPKAQLLPKESSTDISPSALPRMTSSTSTALLEPSISALNPRLGTTVGNITFSLPQERVSWFSRLKARLVAHR